MDFTEPVSLFIQYTSYISCETAKFPRDKKSIFFYLQVKISDFGLSRSLGVGEDYYRYGASFSFGIMRDNVAYFSKLH